MSWNDDKDMVLLCKIVSTMYFLIVMGLMKELDEYALKLNVLPGFSVRKC